MVKRPHSKRKVTGTRASWRRACGGREVRQRFIWSPTSRALLRLPFLSVHVLYIYTHQFFVKLVVPQVFSLVFERVVYRFHFTTDFIHKPTRMLTYFLGHLFQTPLFFHIFSTEFKCCYYISKLTGPVVCSGHLQPTGKWHHSHSFLESFVRLMFVHMNREKNGETKTAIIFFQLIKRHK